MKIQVPVVITTLAAVLGIGSAHGNDWSGFYFGIDARDGSRDQMSISPLGKDGNYEVRMASTGVGDCDRDHPSAFSVATGAVVKDHLVVTEGFMHCTGSKDNIFREYNLERDTQNDTIRYVEPGDVNRYVNLHRLSHNAAQEDPWVGYYMNIDAVDGSVDGTSIVLGADGIYSVLSHSDKFATCQTAHPAAHITAVAKVVDNQLFREKTVFKCDDTDETGVMNDASYSYDPRTGILTLSLPEYGKVLKYHRVSGK